jgi:hypothetical protein
MRMYILYMCIHVCVYTHIYGLRGRRKHLCLIQVFAISHVYKHTHTHTRVHTNAGISDSIAPHSNLSNTGIYDLTYL